MSDDLIFREVNEDLRNEQLRRIWRAFGPYIVAAAVLIVASVAGYKGWTWYADKRAGETGSQFVTALSAADEGREAEALGVLGTVSREGSGDYPLMARFAAAGVKAKTGATNEAIAEFDALAADAGDSEIAAMARLRAAALLIDNGQRGEVERRIADLNDPNSPWRHAARELLGLAAYRAGDADGAAALFRDLLADPLAPQGARQRAEIMLTVIAPLQDQGAGQ